MRSPLACQLIVAADLCFPSRGHNGAEKYSSGNASIMRSTMKIIWEAHACFSISGRASASAPGDLRITTDPYMPERANLPAPVNPADLVIMSSHDDLFHSFAPGVPGAPAIVNALAVARDGGHALARGLPIRAIETRESVIHKAHPDANAMYRFELDGVSVAHMGDVGNPLTPEQLAFLSGVDVLLALTGGPPTIELADLDAALTTIQPRIVIPMHYRIPGLNLKILGVDALLARHPAEKIDIRAACDLTLTRDTLPDTMRIVVLQALATAGSPTQP